MRQLGSIAFLAILAVCVLWLLLVGSCQAPRQSPFLKPLPIAVGR